jgi:hypothetical protein
MEIDTNIAGIFPRLAFLLLLWFYCDKRSNFNMKFVFLRRIIKTLL